MERFERFPIAVAMAIGFALGFLFGWLGTSPWFSMGINWDTAGYSTEIARGGAWGVLPWNSHFGVGQVYWIAMHASRTLGGTMLDGIRALNGIALGISTAVLTLCGLQRKLPPFQAVLIAAMYLGSWGTWQLAFTWEDNLLLHPGALAVLAICFFRVGKWRARDSILTGLGAGIASLMSWQGAAFSFPALYTAVFLGGSVRPAWRRLLDGILVPLGLIAMRSVWVLGYWLSASHLSLSGLLKTAFERPSPNFLPETLPGWWGLLGKWREIFVHAGIGVTHEVGPVWSESAAMVPYFFHLGAFLLGMALFLWVASLLLSPKLDPRNRVLAASFLLLTLASAIYLDFPVDKYKRYDYLPMFFSLGIMALAAWVNLKMVSRPLVQWVLPLVLLLILGGQGFLGYRWNRQWYARLPQTTPLNYAGHVQQTWFAYFRSLRIAHPNACAFVFAFEEVSHARYQLEIPAALYSELPNPIIVGAPPSAAQWPRPLPLGTGSLLQGSFRSCAWISPAARIHTSH